MGKAYPRLKKLCKAWKEVPARAGDPWPEDKILYSFFKEISDLKGELEPAESLREAGIFQKLEALFKGQGLQSVASEAGSWDEQGWWEAHERIFLLLEDLQEFVYWQLDLVDDQDWGNELLQDAISCGEGDLAIALIERGLADPDTRGEEQQPVLCQAVKFRQKRVFDALVHAGAKLKAMDSFGRNAFFFALNLNMSDLMQDLLDRNIYDLSMKDKFGRSPLIAAIEQNNLKMVNFLLKQKGCDPNFKDRWKRQALMVASSRGFEEIVKRLLEIPNLDTDSRNIAALGGSTARELALEAGFPGIAKLIEDYAPSLAKDT